MVIAKAQPQAPHAIPWDTYSIIDPGRSGSGLIFIDSRKLHRGHKVGRIRRGLFITEPSEVVGSRAQGDHIVMRGKNQKKQMCIEESAGTHRRESVVKFKTGTDAPSSSINHSGLKSVLYSSITNHSIDVRVRHLVLLSRSSECPRFRCPCKVISLWHLPLHHLERKQVPQAYSTVCLPRTAARTWTRYW